MVVDNPIHKFYDSFMNEISVTTLEEQGESHENEFHK